MTTITRNLPWFIKDLGVAVVGEKCYTLLVEDLDFADVECLKYSLSKGLGVGIVIGGSIMKVPQLVLIVSARSARGLSLTAYVLETLSYAITLAYSYRNHFPFSTYGENLFLTIQNVIITFLIIYYPSSPRLTRNKPSTHRLGIAILSTLAVAISLFYLPTTTLAPLQLATLPLSLFSKFPQIQQNYRTKSTGQLSAFAVISQIGGCLARLFTTATEVGDPLVSAGFALALLLNCVVGAQLWMYWGADVKEDLARVPTIGITEKDRHWQPESPKVEVVVPPQSPSMRQPAGRKWARKVD
ncbi:mannose-P-dolichol utilization defect 1 protein [Laetiporus sulphureus 93-53]|uniref:Mannose-P-dolichol utilization defect 1 protein homolog n=1 Tax=Laetiporus sulphureus 93-53 TaxID=1314785 RepID=A0A165B7K0_9APHY|nr:mannose-P-dolichol utilization defect 1 protein [Laetiporus sulphureus 93-53]KZT00426.1 mannose-P-dolichol utilization defect 1 protein [Laetiporus sulphureus 93-53]